MVIFIALAYPINVFPQDRMPWADDSTFTQEMKASMEVMDRNITAAPMTGDPDHDFTTMMIPHHQGAIDMAKAVLLHGKDPVIRRLAEEIVVTQQQEIEVMRLRLATLQSGATDVIQQNKIDPVCSMPVSSHDRVYVAEQTSGTVSVIDPTSNKLLGVIHLGDSVPGALSPLYRGQLLVHGLGFSPDHRTIAVVSIGSNSITFIDTETNNILGVVYIGRSPHEAFFTPRRQRNSQTSEMRGENYVSVIDPVQMKEMRRVQTANGPGMVLFRPDGRYAFRDFEVSRRSWMWWTLKTYEVVARVPQVSPFSPNLAVSGDGMGGAWFTGK